MSTTNNPSTNTFLNHMSNPWFGLEMAINTAIIGSLSNYSFTIMMLGIFGYYCLKTTSLFIWDTCKKEAIATEIVKNISEQPKYIFYYIFRYVSDVISNWKNYCFNLLKHYVEQNQSVAPKYDVEFLRKFKGIKLNLGITPEILNCLIRYVRNNGTYEMADTIELNCENSSEHHIKKTYSNIRFDIEKDDKTYCRIVDNIDVFDDGNYIEKYEVTQVHTPKKQMYEYGDFMNELRTQSQFLADMLDFIRMKLDEQFCDVDWIELIKEESEQDMAFDAYGINTNEIDWIYKLMLAMISGRYGSSTMMDIRSTNRHITIDGNFIVTNIITGYPISNFKINRFNGEMLDSIRPILDHIISYHLNNLSGYMVYLSDVRLRGSSILTFEEAYQKLVKRSSDIATTNDKNGSKKDMKTKICLYIHSNKCYSREQLYELFMKFYKTHILISNVKDTVTIYNIKNARIENIVEEDNPEYKQFVEQRNLISGMKDAKGEVKIDITQLKVPSKTIQKTVYSNEIQVTEIAKCKKSLDTLYLRKDDKRRLYNRLDKFRNKIDMYSRLGIQRKLGFLLYGQPGTGKSTTIKAIATYLNKDIYFANLRNVHTNEDLKNMFDYINKSTVSGGVIVFEDIDAMAPELVHPRNLNDGKSEGTQIGKEIEKTVNQVMDDMHDKLSLSTFLNLLDGTLTSDETVVAITTNHIEHIDPAIYRSGRIDTKIHLRLCDAFQISEIYCGIVGKPLSKETLKKIKEFTYSPADIIFELLQNISDDEDECTEEKLLRSFIIP